MQSRKLKFPERAASEQGSEDYGNSVLLHEPSWIPFMRFDIRRNEQNVLQQERLNSVSADLFLFRCCHFNTKIVCHHQIGHIDSLLATEEKFMDSVDIAYVQNRLKNLSMTHSARLSTHEAIPLGFYAPAMASNLKALQTTFAPRKATAADEGHATAGTTPAPGTTSSGTTATSSTSGSTGLPSLLGAKDRATGFGARATRVRSRARLHDHSTSHVHDHQHGSKSVTIDDSKDDDNHDGSPLSAIAQMARRKLQPRHNNGRGGHGHGHKSGHHQQHHHHNGQGGGRRATVAQAVTMSRIEQLGRTLTTAIVDTHPELGHRHGIHISTLPSLSLCKAHV
jgi:hypothetical protein